METFIRNCYQCTFKNKTNTERVEHRWENAEKPFERIHIDWADVPKVGNILIIVDAYTGWPEAFVSQNKSSAVVMKILKALFARFGVPNVVVTDNATEFISEDLIRWLRHVGAKSLQTPQYLSQSNSLVERMAQTLKEF